MRNKAWNNNRRCFLWLAVHHLSIPGQLVTSICSLSFKKYIGNSQRRRRCCQSLRRAAFMYRFSKSSKFYVGDVAIDDQKRREGNKNWKAQLIKRWSWSGVSLVLLSNDLHLFKIIDSWETIHIILEKSISRTHNNILNIAVTAKSYLSIN